MSKDKTISSWRISDYLAKRGKPIIEERTCRGESCILENGIRTCPLELIKFHCNFRDKNNECKNSDRSYATISLGMNLNEFNSNTRN